MLDSSPVPLPPVPRPLKRSASVASLPTPPRTRHKRTTTARSSIRYDPDSEHHSTASEGDKGQHSDPSQKDVRRKKRRTGEKSPAEDDEEAFWMDPGGGPSTTVKSDIEPDVKSGAKSHQANLSSSSSPKSKPAPLLYRRGTGTTGTAPVSPPPSNRKAATTILDLPKTPKRRPRSASPRSASRPFRDSPNNPFLVSPGGVSSVDSSPVPPRTPQKERPTVTYVFRGMRGTFPNPLYDHKNNRPLSPSAQSHLPVEHPDFSPSSHCTPKLLFPEARARRVSKRRRENLGEELEKALEQERARNLRGSAKDPERPSARTLVSWSDDEDVFTDKNDIRDAPRIIPMKLDFSASKGKESVKPKH